MPLHAIRRWSVAIYTLIAAFFSLLLLYHIGSGSPGFSQLISGDRSSSSGVSGNFPLDSHADAASFAAEQAAFLTTFFSLTTKYRPECEPLNHPEDTDLGVGYDANDPSPERPDLLVMTDSQRTALEQSHSDFVNSIQNSDITLPYHRNTRGIVTTAGGPYLPVAVISLRMIRKSGSDLPMEVFLSSKDEWDPHVCDRILPNLNAKCVVLQDLFQLGNIDVQIDKYQYKVMSIMLSSFEDVLFLDSDAFPVFNPDYLFSVEPFISTGLVLWPDFWFPSESPLFFEIANIDMPPLNQKASTESGQMLFSKSKHQDSIMLATYYNLYGPDFFYPLQSQGAPGEGDKETFGWAARVLHKPVYSVKSKVAALGYMTSDNEWRGSAMAQHDPVQDFYQTQQHQGDDAIASGLTKPRTFFIHANYPKFDPATVFNEDAMGGPGPTKDSNGTVRRTWDNGEGTGISVLELGFDIERRFWEQIKITACKNEKDFTAWSEYIKICDNTTQYWNTVFG